MKSNIRKSTRLDVIDVFRFIAALLVVGVHAIVTEYNPPLVTTLFDAASYSLGPFNYFASLIRGHMGVKLFFIISGYCMALVAYNDRHAPVLDSSINGFAKYYKYFISKRIYRIYPLFLIHILLLVLFFHKPKEYLLSTLLFLQNISPNSITAISDVTWSLAVEVQFYLLFPILFLIIKNHPNRLIFIYILSIIYLLISGFIYQFIGNQSVIFILGTNLPIFLHYFLFGLLLYEFKGKIGHYFSRYYSYILLILLFMFSIFYDTGRNIAVPIVEKFHLLFSYAASLLMCFLVEKDFFSGRIIGVFAYLGRASYSIYLMHLFTGPLIHKLRIGFSNRYLLAIQTILFGVVLGVVSYELLEKFFDKRKNAFLAFIMRAEEKKGSIISNVKNKEIIL